MPDSVTQDAATGQAAIDLLRPLLQAIPASELRVPRVNAEKAAVIGLAIDKALKERPDLVARFKSLGTEFKASLEHLQPAARAVLHSRAALLAVQAASSSAKVPVGLLEEAAACKDRMVRMLVYHLENSQEPTHEAAMTELHAICSGRGYLDLAQDLTRLAALHRAHAATLEKDTNYSATEPDVAEAKARAIQDSLATSRVKENPESELALRAWTFFFDLYMEVSETGRWLLRDEPETAAKLFPSLSSGTRARRRATVSEPGSVTQSHG